jgi:hypothetical protein
MMVLMTYDIFFIMITLLLPCVCRQRHGVSWRPSSGEGRNRRNCGSRGAGRRGCAHKVSCSLLVGMRIYLFKIACVLILFAYISKIRANYVVVWLIYVLTLLAYIINLFEFIYIANFVVIWFGFGM